MLEKTVETALTQAIKQHGGLCLKFISPGTAGVPDRIIITPTGQVIFAELKAPGQKPRPLQQAITKKLQAMGCTVHTIDTPQAARKLAHEICTP